MQVLKAMTSSTTALENLLRRAKIGSADSRTSIGGSSNNSALSSAGDSRIGGMGQSGPISESLSSGAGGSTR